MEDNERSDLRINGLGTAAGGKYNFVQINGKGDISGDVECVQLQINGFGSIGGNLKMETARIAGKSEIAGNITGGELTVDGMIEVNGGISAEHIENRGTMQIARDCGAESFKSRGGFSIGGLLNSGKIDVEIYTSCTAREIGGEKINIRKGDAFGFKKFLDSLFPGLGWNRGLSAETVEGDDIYLESTTAKVVRGDNVRLGPGCQIDLVEYRSTLERASDSIIKESKKI
ncbi:MAG TPA: hypothetical protein VIS48_06545 [Candidatus Kryptonia bacterium]